MAKTLAQLRTLTRALLSEPTASYWSDAELNTYINDGANLFYEQTGCLSGISTNSSVQYQSDYDLPSNYTTIQRVEFVKGNSVYDVTPATLKEFYTGVTRNSMTQPYRMNLAGDKLRFDIRPNSAAANTTLTAAISSTSATSLAVASAAGLPREGRIIIDSEVIEYWNISTLTLSPCTRGAEGTTAATHSNGSTVTLRDIWVYHAKRGTELSSDSSTVEIPIQFQNAPAHYAAYIGRMKSKDYDLAAAQLQMFNNYLEQGNDWTRMHWKRSYSPK